MNYREIAAEVKRESFLTASLPEAVRNGALAAIADALDADSETILEANRADLKAAGENHEPAPILNRLAFDRAKLDGVRKGIMDLIGLPDPLFRLLLERELDRGLILRKETCPIGVIGVIFESRPDALVQIASLCVKSGNCAILKGGKEALQTNKALFETIHRAGTAAGLPPSFLTLVETRAGIDELLKCGESVDLLIPRGSNEFVQYIMANSRIPVMGHADGVCHVYVDRDADPDQALPIIMDSKTQYVSACNAAETLLVHRDLAAGFLPLLLRAASEAGVLLRGCPEVMEILKKQSETASSGKAGGTEISSSPEPDGKPGPETLPLLSPASEKDYSSEYLDYILTVKIVGSADEAIAHINRYGSHHTDAILTRNDDTARRFMSNVDSAGVYHNCSTRFADGYRYGFGAEVGISTGKLHARGPVGLDGLVTYKYKLTGSGQIVSDYAKGLRRFHFKDLKQTT